MYINKRYSPALHLIKMFVPVVCDSEAKGGYCVWANHT